jgi:ferrous iron transport protein B
VADSVELACHPAPAPAELAAIRAARRTSPYPVIALVGRPNVGKSTFLARASGEYAESSNLPGTTVGIARREIRIDGTPAVLADLPGYHSLADQSDGLPPFWQLLLAARPDALLVVVDAGDLERHLPLALACRDLQIPIVVAANLADEAAARGIRLDLDRLSQLLAAPVIRTVGRRGEGVMAAVRAAGRVATERHAQRNPGLLRTQPAVPYAAAVVAAVNAAARGIAEPVDRSRVLPDLPADLAGAVDAGWLSPIAAATVVTADVLEPERWSVAQRWAAQVEQRDGYRLPRADRIARRITAPWPGLPVFVAITVLSLGLTMLVGTALSGVLGDLWTTWVTPPLTAVVGGAVPWPPLAAAILWALDGGLLAMLSVGIPYVLSFYLILAILEDSGYLTGAAVLTDRIFNMLGLPGRAAIPVLAATGCNVPAIYGSRVLDTRRERLLASFLVSLTPCSARSAVVVAALAPFAGPGVAFAAFGVITAIVLASGLAANRMLPGRQSPLVLELPPLRVPIAGLVWAKAWHRFRAFVMMATPIMLIGSFILGLAWETGAVGPLGDVIAPVTTGLLGLPPVAGIALILAFLRKELALQLLVVLAVATYGAGAASLGSFMSPAQLFVYAVVTAVSVPCVATLATLRAELGTRAALTVSLAILGVGLGAGAVIARIAGIA